MHARCETDPLDVATDLCQQCGGEYCDDHLVYPYGAKRPPLCKSCAIAVGGVRSGAAVVRKRSRAQVKRRRAELRSVQHERRSTGFEFFEADAPFPPADPGPADDPAPAPVPAAAGTGTGDELPASGPEADVVPEPAGRRSSLWRRRRSAGTTLPVAPEPEPGADPRRLGADLPDPISARTSAKDLLTRLRESGAVPPSIERRGRDRVDVLSTRQDPDDELPPGWAMPAQAPEPLGDGEPTLEALAESGCPSAIGGEAPPEVPAVESFLAVSEVAPPPPPACDIDVEVRRGPAPLRGPDSPDPPVTPEWLLRTVPPAPLITINRAHDLVLPSPPPQPGDGPADGGPWVPPALRGVDQPLTARLLEADQTDPVALGSTFGGATASHPAVQPQVQATPPAGVDDDDDPWAGVPPALRGGGWRPTGF